MSDLDQQLPPSTEWDLLINQHIAAICDKWNSMSVDERFWRVFNWLKEYRITSPDKAKRSLLFVKPYWLKSCEE